MGNASLPVKSLPVEKRRGNSPALGINQGGPAYNAIHVKLVQMPTVTYRYRTKWGQDPASASICGRARRARHGPRRKSGTAMDPPPSEETPEQAAQYIAALTQELAALARRVGLETLSQILEMPGSKPTRSASDRHAICATGPMRGSLWLGLQRPSSARRGRLARRHGVRSARQFPIPGERYAPRVASYRKAG
jgi:hypothetical protein